ncbi:antA/AntB antirepressor family protein [Corynebacterium axilliensis]|uniref:antA/AntB antirepressor family protein n=1 Tax=Corynebacterium sp. YSMAA5_1_F9 TaxID=3383591 RepID=UPI0038D028B6
MSELIPIHSNDGAQAVMGRDLYDFLGVETEYRHWFPRMVEYGFEEGKDYAVKNDRVQDSLGRSRERTNHVISLDMAKEISMIQRSEKGKQARQYFIECERRVKSSALAIPQTYAEALRAAADNAERAAIEARNAAEQMAIAQKATATIERQAPKVAKADAHSGVKEWKRRQDFYREVQQWGDLKGLDIKQSSVRQLLTRKSMLIGGARTDAGQMTRSAVKAGWGRNEKGVADNGHSYCTPQLSPAGQDIAWKWIYQASQEYGEILNPKEGK